MPVTPTYPGVYIEEIPSGVHTITGVATSIAAFVDFFTWGQMNQAVQPLFRTSVGTCYLQKTCGKPVFHVRTRKLAPISQSPQQVASRIRTRCAESPLDFIRNEFFSPALR